VEQVLEGRQAGRKRGGKEGRREEGWGREGREKGEC
jgi:hypothetical protein